MSLYFVRTPRILQNLFKNVTWRIEKSDAIYLTFDDGPNPEVTVQLLELLKANNAHATFFLLGKNAASYPELVARIQKENHTIGFHGNEHLNSRKLNRIGLLKNFRCQAAFPKSKLYRPPFGKLKYWQYNYLQKKFQLVGWTLMPGDFDSKKNIKHQLRDLQKAKSGDIVVLHELPNTIQLLEAYFKQTPYRLFEKL
jgi:peptidoglycan/xylan/chitin deacetylase (PgdA/CDA1 family)